VLLHHLTMALISSWFMPPCSIPGAVAQLARVPTSKNMPISLIRITGLLYIAAQTLAG
jgi:hypothetical protein